MPHAKRLMPAAMALSLLAAAPSALAEPFEVRLTAGGQTASRSFTDIESAIDQVSDTPALLNPAFSDPDIAARFDVNLRGLPAVATYAQGSNALNFRVDLARVNETFTGSSRQESAEQLREYLEGRDGRDTISQILAAAARFTAGDPVAGNPNSLMNRMIQSDFDRALDAAGGVRTGGSLGVRFGSFSAAGINSRNVSLPLGYSRRLSDRDVLEVDAPIAWTDTEGANSYSGNIGLLWRRQILPNWTLQPSARFGAIGSRDLGSGAGAWSAALNSTVNFDLPASLRLTVANGLTYISTVPVSLGGTSLDYGIQNLVFRNGAVLGRDLGFDVLRMPVRGSVFAVDTRFTGDAVFARQYQEFGLFFSAGGVNPIRLGVTYLTGSRDLRGFTVNTGVAF